MKLSNSHIDDQPERLEAYLLGRLTHDESNAIDAHLRGCGKCAAAVAAEQRVIAAIRRAGRDAVKAQLRASLAEEKDSSRRTTPWPRILAAAATIVILVGFGLAGRWMYTHYTNRLQPSEEAVRSVPGGNESLTQTQQGKQEQTPPPVSSELQREAAKPGRAFTVEDGIAKKGELAEETSRQHNQPAPVVAGPMRQEETRTDENPRLSPTGRNAVSRAVAGGAGSRGPVVVAMRIIGAEPPGLYKMRRADTEMKTTALDTTTIRIVLYLPPYDSAFLHLTPTTRWITDDSVLVSVGDTTAGFRIQGRP